MKMQLLFLEEDISMNTDLQNKINYLGKYCYSHDIEITDLMEIVNRKEYDTSSGTSIQKMIDLKGQLTKTGDLIVYHDKNWIYDQQMNVVDEKNNEVLICRYLIANYGSIMSIQEILFMLEKHGVHIGRASLITYINRIRKRISKYSDYEYIHNYFGRGYRWEVPVQHVFNENINEKVKGGSVATFF